MEYPKEGSASLYDYSDKSVRHAGYAAVTYAAISLFSGILVWIQYFLYHRPGTGGILNRDVAGQQYLQHNPLDTAAAVVFSVVIAAISGVLAFFIFRHSRFAIVTMVIVVVVLQLLTWFVLHSGAGSLLSVVVIAFLLRGTRRMFQDHAERQMESRRAEG